MMSVMAQGFFIPINEERQSGAQWLDMLINIIKREHCKCCKESLISTRAACKKKYMPSAAICYSNYTVRVAQTFSVIEDYNKDSGSLSNDVMTFALE